MISVISRSHARDPEKTAYEDALADLFAERAGASVLIVPHLYHLAEDDAVWAELAGAGGLLLVLAWLYPRPAEWLLRRHALGQAGLQTFDMGAYDRPEACFEAATKDLEPAAGKGMIRDLGSPPASRWHPVIDYSRCTGCGQCMQFCLFGVYELDGAETVRATHPDNCKPGCPACARICPVGAIMFPLCDRDEAIAGAPGKFASPHAAAKKMFEKRTRRPHPQPQAADDLDALIDDLDRLTEGTP